MSEFERVANEAAKLLEKLLAGDRSGMSEFERIAVIEVGTKGIRLLVVQRRNPPEGMEVLESRGELGNLGKVWTGTAAG